jgi:hypothetical protein
VSVQSVAAADPSIVALLRSRTQDAHSALEAQLGLLEQPASIDYYAHLLLRLLGFHLVWENDLQEFPTLARELQTRSRIRHLRDGVRSSDGWKFKPSTMLPMTSSQVHEGPLSFFRNGCLHEGAGHHK